MLFERYSSRLVVDTGEEFPIYRTLSDAPRHDPSAYKGAYFLHRRTDCGGGCASQSSLPIRTRYSLPSSLRGNGAFDNLIWPHFDTYIWPHLINKDTCPVGQRSCGSSQDGVQGKGQRLWSAPQK